MRNIKQMIGQPPKYYQEANMHHICTHFGETEREQKMLDEFKKKPYFLTIGGCNEKK